MDNTQEKSSHRASVFQNRFLRRIFEHKSEASKRTLAKSAQSDPLYVHSGHSHQGPWDGNDKQHRGKNYDGYKFWLGTVKEENTRQSQSNKSEIAYLGAPNGRYTNSSHSFV